MTVVAVNLTDDGHFLLRGGSIHGRDPVFRAVTAWPGWKRVQTLGKLGDQAVSCYRAPLNPSSAFYLMNTTMGIVWEEGAKEKAEELLHRLERSRLGLRVEFISPPKGMPGEREAMKHQLNALAAIDALGGSALLADDMGLGKTATSLWSMHRQGVSRILVICPASVKYNWDLEKQATLGTCRTWIIDGTKTRRANLFSDIQAALGKDGPMSVAIINYDLLRGLPEHQLQILKDFVRDQGIICDESHYLKSIKAERTKRVMEIVKEGKPRCRLLLSGTPVRNMVDDLYSQVELVQPGTWTSVHDFNKRHLVVKPVSFGAKTVNKVVGTRRLSELNTVMNTVQIRRKKGDVLDLPEMMHTYPELEFDDYTKQLYGAMKDYALFELSKFDDGSDIVFNPEVQGAVQVALRCEQLCQGFVGGIPEPVMDREIAKTLVSAKASKIPGRPGELLFPSSSKLVWLRETIRTLIGTGNVPVIMSQFNGPLTWLMSEYEEDAFFMHGGVKAKARGEMLEAFKEGQRNMFLCQVKIAEGFNLIRSQDCIFLGCHPAPAVNVQAENRCHRIGTKGTVNIQIPFVRKSIEERIHRKLRQKWDIAEKALVIRTIRELKEAL